MTQIQASQKRKKKAKNSRNRSIVDEEKASRGAACSRCGYAGLALDWHHKDGSDKVNTIGRLYNGASVNKLMSELAKCELICCNCHAEEHRSGA